MKDPITVEAVINAPVEKVWAEFNNPESIKAWNTPSPDWHTPKAESDLKEGGRFNYRMEAKDGSAGFDFSGTYTSVVPNEKVAYKMDDGRESETTFTADGESTKIVTQFEPENENPPEFQRSGWQAILDNFKKHAEQS